MTPEFPTLMERCRDWNPALAIVTGSGLGTLGSTWEVLDEVSWSDIPALPDCGVPGHNGSFVRTRYADTEVILSRGRIHLYEGHTAEQVTAPVRALAAIGVQRLILTNAAGAIIHPSRVGEWMLISDHINLTGESPLRGSAGFIDMTNAWDLDLRDALRSTARRLDIPLLEGVYAGVRGPQYETPAEIRMLATMGAGAVGMSTVLECIQARALRMKVAGFSCLTNAAAGLSEEGLSHEDVVETGRKAAASLSRLLEGWLTGS